MEPNFGSAEFAIAIVQSNTVPIEIGESGSSF
jgi:hypothetical protein